jgi:hypothetical protein
MKFEIDRDIKEAKKKEAIANGTYVPTEEEETEEIKPAFKIINVDYKTDSDYDYNH